MGNMTDYFLGKQGAKNSYIDIINWQRKGLKNFIK